MTQARRIFVSPCRTVILIENSRNHFERYEYGGIGRGWVMRDQLLDHSMREVPDYWMELTP
jgi:hypothetical protein